MTIHNELITEGDVINYDSINKLIAENKRLKKLLCRRTKTAYQLHADLQLCDYEYVQACHSELNQLRDDLRWKESVISAYIEARR